MTQRIKTRPVEYRQATAGQLTQENPVLAVGQVAREKDYPRYKIGDGVTAYADLPYAVDMTAPVDVAAVSGAVVIDCSLGSVFVLALTGNISSFTLSNLASGKVVEVHFVQDATGTRTLSSVHASVKLAGGALTLTTTASKRDVLRLRSIGNVSYEISRSMDI